jgi:hypothetical protein
MITLEKPKQRNLLQPILQLGFDLTALYLLHVITIHMWRAMTGH